MSEERFALKWKISTFGDRYSCHAHNEKELSVGCIGTKGEGWHWIIWKSNFPDKKIIARSPV